MKQIKVSPVVYEMLQELSKKKRVNIERLLAEVVSDAYNKLKRMN